MNICTSTFGATKMEKEIIPTWNEETFIYFHLVLASIYSNAFYLVRTIFFFRTYMASFARNKNNKIQTTVLQYYDNKKIILHKNKLNYKTQEFVYFSSY